MASKNKKIGIFSICCLLNGCATVEDYVLGKDNTPKPAELQVLKPKMDLVEKWSVPIGKPNKSKGYLKLKPEIADAYIYTADSNGLVQAVNKTNAKIAWSKHFNHPIISGPTVKNGYIAVSTDDAKVAVLNQKNGQQLWQSSVSSDVLSKPAIADGKVIVKTIDGNLYAFNVKTGQKIWVSNHGAPNLILKASSSPVIVGDLVLVGFSDGKLDAIDIKSGEQKWQRSIAFANGPSDVERLVDIDADPIVQGSTAYLASFQGYVGALSLQNGQFLWQKPASTYKNIALDEHTLYMTDSDEVIWAFARNTGKVKWKQPALKARGLTEPVLMKNQLLIADRTGYLHILSKQDGEFLTRKQLGSAIDIPPTVSGNEIYVLSANGKLNHLSVS